MSHRRSSTVPRDCLHGPPEEVDGAGEELDAVGEEAAGFFPWRLWMGDDGSRWASREREQMGGDGSQMRRPISSGEPPVMVLAGGQLWVVSVKNSVVFLKKPAPRRFGTPPRPRPASPIFFSTTAAAYTSSRWRRAPSASPSIPVPSASSAASSSLGEMPLFRSRGYSSPARLPCVCVAALDAEEAQILEQMRVEERTRPRAQSGFSIYFPVTTSGCSHSA